MKKFLKYFLLFLVLGVVYIVYQNYPRLDIITGFSAKSTASVVFLADRTIASVEEEDNNFPPINYADIKVDSNRKTASASVIGMKKRTAIYREGLGTVLINDDFDESTEFLVPVRNKIAKNLPFPYGNLKQKDTVFSNVNYDKLNKFVNNYFDSIHKTRSVLVIYKDQIIAEQNADGFNENSLHLGWSMTKSITATIYGILQKQEKLNVTDKVGIDTWRNDERSDITLNNLLQMNSGLEWVEDYNNISDVTKMLFIETNMAKVQEGKKRISKPNKSWNYSSGTSNLLSGLLRNYFTTHQEYLDYWYGSLIDRIGMNSMLIETDLAGNYVGSSYGWASTRDWAKFGLLYLHKGNWNGEQLFDASWIDYVTTPTATSNGEYGGHFWLNAGGKYPDAPKDVYSANGYQGQRVFIIPSKDLVIVRMGLGSMDFNIMLKEIVESIE